jgi:hypothetical protein
LKAFTAGTFHGLDKNICGVISMGELIGSTGKTGIF